MHTKITFINFFDIDDVDIIYKITRDQPYYQMFLDDGHIEHVTEEHIGCRVGLSFARNVVTAEDVQNKTHYKMTELGKSLMEFKVL